MYVVLGASGNTGHIVAKSLLAQQKKVRVVGRNAAHLQSLVAQGAEPFVGDLIEASTLIKAFQQADSAYVMIPPNLSTSDPRGFQERVSDSIAAAVKNSNIKTVIALSSIGADKPSRTGPVVGLHHLEQKLSQINSVNLLFLRAAYFMENTLVQTAIIRMMGSTAGPLRPDLKVPMIDIRDIGAAAAEALLQPSFDGKQTRELLGQRDLDYNEVTAIIGKAIGKPDLKYIQPPDEQVRAGMVQSGMSDQLAGLLIEMAEGLNSGYMRALEPRTARNTTRTPFETFVSETFVPAYRQQPAA
jgi:uncharacterized protein YbjT (DUF2867 family)